MSCVLSLKFERQIYGLIMSYYYGLCFYLLNIFQFKLIEKKKNLKLVELYIHTQYIYLYIIVHNIRIMGVLMAQTVCRGRASQLEICS